VNIFANNFAFIVKIINLDLPTLTAILFAWNHPAIFLISVLTNETMEQ
jgi:hypothetical protein